MSRAAFAKPFLTLPGRERPLLADTFARICESDIAPDALMVIAAERDLFLCRELAGQHAPNLPHLFVGEPQGRNTAPAIAAAACLAAQRFGEDAVLLVLPADHLVGNSQAFWRAATCAMQAAERGKIALLGISPDYPATGYGYIEPGEEEADSCFAVRRFVEKPDSQRAAQFVSDGFLWNAGIFCFTPGTLFAELAEIAPDLHAPLSALQNTIDNEASWMPPGDQYARMPSVSFDYAVMEKTTRAAVVAAKDAQWSDVGSWRALSDSLPADKNGNRNFGDAELLECRDCFISGNGGRLIVAAGIRGMHIIDEPDALLVCEAGFSERVREVSELLQKQNRPQAETPVTVRRPWGSYTVLSEGDGYKVKRIEVLPGAKLSLQSHKHRAEQWTTVAGVMTVTIDGREFRQSIGESCHIPLGAKHRMANETGEVAAVIEVQTGDYLGEDDIVRYEDIYGRV